MSDVRLVVQADDFGMCHAVNDGTITAFTDGIVTQAAVMMPTPWVAEAAAQAADRSIPCGVHLTLTCEWDNLRWGPLTDGASLVEADGTFRRTLAAVMADVDRDEATVETAAQISAFRRMFGDPVSLDPHMGAVPRSVVERACVGADVPFLYPIGPKVVPFDSTTLVSDRGGEDKTAWLVELIERLTPGLHFFCTHPAPDTAELQAIANADAENRPWATTYRISDLDALCSRDVRRAIERRGVELVAVSDLG